jgi:methylated-DNA-protein-cysteine methyltransferase-like protein
VAADDLTPFERAVVSVLRGTEPGDVLSYGDVAAEAGYPGAARAVGNVLARTEGLPWWRVVSASGRLIPHNPAEQARRLAEEGVVCRHGRVVADRPGPLPEWPTGAVTPLNEKS